MYYIVRIAGMGWRLAWTYKNPSDEDFPFQECNMIGPGFMEKARAYEYSQINGIDVGPRLMYGV